MHSIYWVPSRDCNQRCPHCYNDSQPGAAGLTLDEAERCIANMPRPEQAPVKMVMISGGEVLVWPDLLFAILKRLNEHFGEQTELAIQTNGDLLDAPVLRRLLDHRISSISVASNDRYHLQATRRNISRVVSLLDAHGLKRKHGPDDPDDPADPGEAWWRPPEQRPVQYDVWGANEGSWIGPLWPRGRAHMAGISKASPEDNFCGNWSGAKGFLDYHDNEQCQVNVQLSDVYPCCPMTCRPIGDLASESLLMMLDRCAEHPVYQALNDGEPERMGQAMGISEAHGRERTKALGNHCLWCDEFFTEHAPHLLKAGTRTERGTVDLTISAGRSCQATG